MAATEVETALKFQTWNLKVSIHCEGCKRKVKKVLQSIEGVYTTSVDAQKQKVTVTGNVAVEILIKKLIKMGKHVELYPEPKPANPNQNGNNGGGGGGKKNKKNKGKNDGSKPDGENPDNPEPEQPEPETKSVENCGGVPQSVENPEISSPQTEKPAGKKKGKNKNTNTNGEKPNGSAGQNANAKPPNENQKPVVVPHQQQGLNLPAYPLPQYVMSYSSVQPTMAGMYYAPTVSTASATGGGGYDIFSEENANACMVM